MPGGSGIIEDQGSFSCSQYRGANTRGRRYLGGFWWGQKYLEEWIPPKVVEWSGAMKTLGRIAKIYIQTACSRFAVSLQVEWHYLKRAIPRVVYLMGPVEDAIT